MRGFSFACGMALALASGAALAQPTSAPAIAPASAPTTVAAPAFTSSTTQLGTLLANPAAKAVLAKHIPEFINNIGENLERVTGMTLKEVQDAIKAYSPDALSDARLAAIDADLAKLPAGS